MQIYEKMIISEEKQNYKVAIYFGHLSHSQEYKMIVYCEVLLFAMVFTGSISICFGS